MIPKLIEIRGDLIQLNSSLDYLTEVGGMPKESVNLKGEMRAIRITRQSRVKKIKEKLDKLIEKKLEKY